MIVPKWATSLLTTYYHCSNINNSARQNRSSMSQSNPEVRYRISSEIIASVINLFDKFRVIISRSTAFNFLLQKVFTRKTKFFGSINQTHFLIHNCIRYHTCPFFKDSFHESLQQAHLLSTSLSWKNTTITKEATLIVPNICAARYPLMN